MHPQTPSIQRTWPSGRRAFLKAGLAAAALAGLRRLASATLTALPLLPPAAGEPAAAGAPAAAGMPAAGMFPGLTIYPRHAWTWLKPRPELMRPAYDYKRLTVHHAGNGVNTHTNWDEVIFDLNGVMEAHLQNRFGDIAYHFIIDYAGRIWAGRPLCYTGAHVSGFNDNNLGVMLQGNFEEQRPAPAQIQALFALINAAQQIWNIPGNAIYGHRDLGRSACPGAHLYPLLAYYKNP